MRLFWVSRVYAVDEVQGVFEEDEPGQLVAQLVQQVVGQRLAGQEVHDDVVEVGDHADDDAREDLLVLDEQRREVLVAFFEGVLVFLRVDQHLAGEGAAEQDRVGPFCWVFHVDRDDHVLEELEVLLVLDVEVREDVDDAGARAVEVEEAQVLLGQHELLGVHFGSQFVLERALVLFGGEVFDELQVLGFVAVEVVVFGVAQLVEVAVVEQRMARVADFEVAGVHFSPENQQVFLVEEPIVELGFVQRDLDGAERVLHEEPGERLATSCLSCRPVRRW